MIHVLATAQLRAGKRAEFLREFERVRPLVLAEDGCLEYGAAVGVDTGLTSGDGYTWMPAPADTVTVVEKWASMALWKAHITAPHMDDYRARTRDIVFRRIVQVLQPV